MTVLALDGLSVHRGGRPVVHGVSLDIPAGQVTALLGPNGAGKSSLVLAVGGVLRPAGGTVTLDGHDLTGRRPEHTRRAGVAVVPEGRRVLSELTVEDNYGTHEVKLPAGDMVLYPSTSLHHVKPVTRGVRVASFFWLQSMVRDDGARTLLFDLDQTIQELTAERGLEDPACVRLTGIYHNLIRYWADA